MRWGGPWAEEGAEECGLTVIRSSLCAGDGFYEAARDPESFLSVPKQPVSRRATGVLFDMFLLAGRAPILFYESREPDIFCFLCFGPAPGPERVRNTNGGSNSRSGQNISGGATTPPTQPINNSGNDTTNKTMRRWDHHQRHHRQQRRRKRSDDSDSNDEWLQSEISVLMVRRSATTESPGQ